MINFIMRVLFISLCLFLAQWLYKKYKERKASKDTVPESYEVGKAYVDVVTLDGQTHTRKFCGRAYWSTGYSNEAYNTVSIINVEDRVMNWIKNSGKQNIFVIDWYVSIPLHQVRVINVRYEKYQVKL